MPARGTPARRPAATMADVDPAGDWRGGWAGRALRRLAAAPHAPAVAGALLARGSRWPRRSRRPAGDRGDSRPARPAVVLVLLALAHHGAARLLWAHPAAAAVAVCRGVRAVPRGLPDADRGRPDRAAGRRCTGSAAAAHSCWPRRWRCRSWCWRWPTRSARRQDPRRAAGRAGPGGGAGPGPPGGPAARPSQHSAARQVIAGTPGRAHGPRGTRPHLPRAARRRRPPHLHDRRAGGDGPADHPGDARRRGAAAVRDRRHRAGRADRDAAAARRAARGHPGRRPAPTGSPQPGLRQLNELLDEARDASGAGIRLIVCGPLPSLDPGVELAAYRIVQEALTNARRHAPGAAVDVELHYTADALRLRVRDNGPGPAAGGAGRAATGWLGMRERAAAVGGELRTGAGARRRLPGRGHAARRGGGARRDERDPPGGPDRRGRRPPGGAHRVRRAARHPAGLRGRRHGLRRGRGGADRPRTAPWCSARGSRSSTRCSCRWAR